MIKVEFIENSLNVKKLGNGTCDVLDFCLNSKEIKKGECFVALYGKNNNGNEYIKEAFINGAIGCIIDEKYKSIYLDNCLEFHNSTWCIIVQDVKKKFLFLSKCWRDNFSEIPSIGITGSVGKTTTKEIIGSILKSTKHIPLITKDSQNGIIGLALTLLKLRNYHTIIVCEVGISEIGEMEILSEALSPSIAIITNVGKAHLNGLKNLQNIAFEKSKICKFLKNNGHIVINGDIPELTKLEYNGKLITFGKKKTNHVRLNRISFAFNFLNGYLNINNIAIQIKLKSVNLGFANSVLAAISGVLSLGIDISLIKEAIQNFVPLNGRFNIVSSKIGGNFIDDSYNANPESMKASLMAFEKIDKSKKKVFVFGDMLDLGDVTYLEHKKIINLLKKFENLKEIILVGKITTRFESILPLWMNVYSFYDWESSIDCVKNFLKKEYLVLLKGSNSINLGNIINKINE